MTLESLNMEQNIILKILKTMAESSEAKRFLEEWTVPPKKANLHWLLRDDQFR